MAGRLGETVSPSRVSAVKVWAHRGGELSEPRFRLVFLQRNAENEGMLIRGRVHNGVVSFPSDVSLPEGLEVTVVVPTSSESSESNLSEQDLGRIRKMMDDIASLPDENPGDAFSGAEHDKVLYGEP